MNYRIPDETGFSKTRKFHPPENLVLPVLDYFRFHLERPRSSSVEPVPQELLDIIDKINSGDERVSNMERCLVHVLDRLNSIDAEAVVTEERLSRIEARLNGDTGRHLAPEIDWQQESAEGASSGFVSLGSQGSWEANERQRADRQPGTDNILNAGQQQLRFSGQQNVDDLDRNIRDDGHRNGPDYSRQPSRERFRMPERPVWEWAEIEPGKFVYLKYYKMWHAVLVTGCDPGNGRVRGIHYGWKSFFGRREVSEDNFRVNLQNGDVWEVQVPEGRRVPAEEAVARGREKVGEKQFNMFTRRSRHMVLECVLK